LINNRKVYLIGVKLMINLVLAFIASS